MVYCNRDMCFHNFDLYCLRQNIVLKVELNGDEEKLICKTYQAIGGKNERNQTSQTDTQ